MDASPLSIKPLLQEYRVAGWLAGFYTGCVDNRRYKSGATSIANLFFVDLQGSEKMEEDGEAVPLVASISLHINLH